jgi:hypothetical protein
VSRRNEKPETIGTPSEADLTRLMTLALVLATAVLAVVTVLHHG